MFWDFWGNLKTSNLCHLSLLPEEKAQKVLSVRHEGGILARGLNHFSCVLLMQRSSSSTLHDRHSARCPLSVTRDNPATPRGLRNLGWISVPLTVTPAMQSLSRSISSNYILSWGQHFPAQLYSMWVKCHFPFYQTPSEFARTSCCMSLFPPFMFLPLQFPKQYTASPDSSHQLPLNSSLSSLFTIFSLTGPFTSGSQIQFCELTQHQQPCPFSFRESPGQWQNCLLWFHVPHHPWNVVEICTNLYNFVFKHLCPLILSISHHGLKSTI